MDNLVQHWLRVRATEDTIREENQSSCSKLRFAINLGDLIDGKNCILQRSSRALSRAKDCLAPFEQKVGPVHHIVGNHELYNFTPQVFAEKLLWKGNDSSVENYDKDIPLYYDFYHPEAPQFRFIILNTYGLSSLGRGPHDPVFKRARELLRRTNPNSSFNSSDGLLGLEQRFAEFNGAVDETQLLWLSRTLENASVKNEKVLIFTHIPIHPESCPPSCLLWNYDEVLKLLFTFSDNVRAVFSGHAHTNGHSYSHGIHFFAYDALLECAPNETAYAIVDLFPHQIIVNGYGKIKSFAFDL